MLNFGVVSTIFHFSLKVVFGFLRIDLDISNYPLKRQVMFIWQKGALLASLCCGVKFATPGDWI